MSFLEKKLFQKHQTSFLTKNKRSSKSTSYISVKEAQKSLLNSLSKNNDDYIIREYSKINPQDFNSYIETVDSSLNNYMMDSENKIDDKYFKHFSPNRYISYCYNVIDNKWYCYDDENVKIKDSFQEVISGNYIPYMLFYKSIK